MKNEFKAAIAGVMQYSDNLESNEQEQVNNMANCAKNDQYSPTSGQIAYLSALSVKYGKKKAKSKKKSRKNALKAD